MRFKLILQWNSLKTTLALAFFNLKTVLSVLYNAPICIRTWLVLQIFISVPVFKTKMGVAFFF